MWLPWHFNPVFSRLCYSLDCAVFLKSHLFKNHKAETLEAAGCLRWNWTTSNNKRIQNLFASDQHRFATDQHRLYKNISSWKPQLKFNIFRGRNNKGMQICMYVWNISTTHFTTSFHLAKAYHLIWYQLYQIQIQIQIQIKIEINKYK